MMTVAQLMDRLDNYSGAAEIRIEIPTVPPDGSNLYPLDDVFYTTLVDEKGCTNFVCISVVEPE